MEEWMRIVMAISMTKRFPARRQDTYFLFKTWSIFDKAKKPITVARTTQAGFGWPVWHQ